MRDIIAWLKGLASIPKTNALLSMDHHRFEEGLWMYVPTSTMTRVVSRGTSNAGPTSIEAVDMFVYTRPSIRIGQMGCSIVKDTPEVKPRPSRDVGRRCRRDVWDEESKAAVLPPDGCILLGSLELAILSETESGLGGAGVGDGVPMAVSTSSFTT